MKPVLLLAGLAGAVIAASAGAVAQTPPLELEAKIALGQVSGRIDHMAIDLGRERLFVAELGNDSVGVVDLKNRTVRQRITGLREPQGTGYVAATDTLYVANARDGSVTLYRGESLAPAGRIALGGDADNIRVEPGDGRVFIGYGEGAIAIIDPRRRETLADIMLKAHPEGFQLDPAGARIFVNLPNAREIAVLDRQTAKQIGAWHVPGANLNFPMAVDPQGERVFAVFRRPARLIVLAASTGAVTVNIETCGDADDVFFDARRGRVYVSCGEGYLDVLDAATLPYARIGHVPTASGARTSLFVPALDRLYLAVRATASEPAALWVFRPAP